MQNFASVKLHPLAETDLESIHTKLLIIRLRLIFENNYRVVKIVVNQIVFLDDIYTKCVKYYIMSISK